MSRRKQHIPAGFIMGHCVATEPASKDIMHSSLARKYKIRPRVFPALL